MTTELSKERRGGKLVPAADVKFGEVVVLATEAVAEVEASEVEVEVAVAVKEGGGGAACVLDSPTSYVEFTKSRCGSRAGCVGLHWNGGSMIKRTILTDVRV